MKEKKLIPRIRFSEFSDPWKQCDFDEVFDYLGKNSLSRAKLTSQRRTLQNVHYGDILTKYGSILDTSIECIPYIEDENLTSKLMPSLLKDGDIIIADAAEDDTVGKATEIVNIRNSKVVSGLHTIPCRPKCFFGKGYLGYYTNSKAYHNQLLPLMQGTKVSSISKTILKETIIRFPSSTKEQELISKYLLGVDRYIELQQQEYNKLLIIKKAMLGKMFPKSGAEVPMIRFKEFSTPWKQYKLSECFDERREKSSVGELISVTINDGIKKFSELGRHDNSSDDKSNYKRVEIGDIAYNSMRMWQGASGYSQYSGIVSPAYTVITPKEGVDSLFFSYIFKIPQMINIFKLRSQGITSDTWNLKYPAFGEIEVLMPTLAEQKKIRDYFKKIDQLINLHKYKLEKLKNIKSGCLEQMFV